MADLGRDLFRKAAIRTFQFGWKISRSRIKASVSESFAIDKDPFRFLGSAISFIPAWYVLFTESAKTSKKRLKEGR